MNYEQKIQVNREKKIQHSTWVTVLLVLYDVLAVSFAYFAALWIRFNFSLSALKEGPYLSAWCKFAPFYALLCVLLFWLLKLYKSIWKFVSFKELERITLASVVTAVLHVLLITSIFQRMPLSYYFLGALLQFVLICGVRFSYRFFLFVRSDRENDQQIPVLVFGAGSAANLICKEIMRSPEMKERVVCILDDNPNKWHRDLDGVPIVGGREMIPEAVKRFGIKKIYIAIPSISSKERSKIIDLCKETGCELKTLPGIYQLMLGQITFNMFRDVNVEDLLGREPVKLESPEVKEYLEGKTVLITGGGGSIGSELCRQVAAVKGLKRLIIFDIYENNAHAIKLELTDKYPNLDLVTLIGSVRNSQKVKQVFHDYRPDIVFHAAAHKHVPLMEDSPCEAIKNNVMGTYNTAYAALACNCEKFVLISTDKAVNPVNIMGASKRLCEMIVQAFGRKVEAGKAREIPNYHAHMISGEGGGSGDDLLVPPDHPRTEFVAVRFGNVLGSNGSVIPRFREQIREGRAVTVTHPDMIRYFMTIPEAASLVLTAATFGGGGKIFVLDMGTPVKIDTLARDMIKLSGLKPDKDISIVYTGLRPGEKLYEERLMDEEGLRKTSNELISVGQPIAFDEDTFFHQLPDLFKAAYEDRKDIRELVQKLVVTYHPAGENGTVSKGEAYRHQREEMLAHKTSH